jgi:hypothetical protein
MPIQSVLSSVVKAGCCGCYARMAYIYFTAFKSALCDVQQPTHHAEGLAYPKVLAKNNVHGGLKVAISCVFLSISLFLSISIVLTIPVYSCLFPSIPVFSCLFLSIPTYYCLRVYSCLFLSIPVYFCLFLSIPVYSCLFLSIPVYSCLFLSIPVYSCLFQHMPVYSSICLSIPAYSCLFLSVCLFVFTRPSGTRDRIFAKIIPTPTLCI